MDIKIYEYAAKWVLYDPETGDFYRTERPKSHFRNGPGYSNHLKSVGNKANRSKPSLSKKRTSYQAVLFSIDSEQFEIPAHRLAWLCYYGNMPEEIDHIDGDGTNNAIKNLRSVTRKQNMENKKLYHNNKTGIHGVYKEKDRMKWTVCIQGKRIARADDFFEACCARRSIEKDLKYHQNHGRS